MFRLGVMGTSMDELGSRFLSGVMAGVKSRLSRDSRLLDGQIGPAFRAPLPPGPVISDLAAVERFFK